MRTSKKIVAAAVCLIVAVVAVYMAHWLIRYYFYNDYKEDLSSYEYEEGSAFTAIKESSPDVEGMELAAENDNLKLYVDTQMGNVAVVDKRNGQITYSNPTGLEEDGIANEANKNYMRSQLIVEYFNTSRTLGTFDSYSFAAEKGQIETEAIKDGIRFRYTLGDLSSVTGIVPQYISVDTLHQVTTALSEKDAKEVLKKYVESDVQDGYMELLESTMKGKSQLRKLNRYFEEAGFTEEMYTVEMENSGVEGAVPISFMVPLEYRLREDAVDVSIPMSAVEENGGGAIFRIQVLRYFGAAGTDENGYLLVPNGSGSLIYFNNGKAAADVYSEYVYGIDPLAAEYTVRENTEDVKMALYGIFRENSAIFATIEDGAGFATIGAGVSGKVNEYNNAYATFVVRGNDRLSMFGTTGNEADIPIVEKNHYDANLTVRYTMLTQENASYAGAANYYRNRLVQEGVLNERTDAAGDIKFYYDTLGGVRKIKYFLGVPFDSMYSMTDFGQAQEIYQDLKDNGVTNQVMNYQGWMNRGYNHDVVDKIKVPHKLGGKSGLEDLSAVMAADGNDFYGDVAFQHVTYVSKRYSDSNETSRYYGGGYIAEFGLVNPATLRQTSGLGYGENHFFLTSPKFLVRYTDKFTDKITKYDINGISLRDLGNELHSDKKRTNVIDREAALDVVDAALAQIDGAGKKIMLNDANDYAFAYANDIINAPLTDNDYYIVDETVPFYEMLIHGYIDYAGGAINLSDTYDRTDIVLNLVETGASPHFMFSARNSSDIKQTGLNRFYATTYESWKNDAIAIYTEVNEALKHVQGASITDHRIIDKDMRAVTYDNGITIYINTGNSDKTADGVTVPARSYQIGGM